MVLEMTPESPLDSKKIKPVNLKGNQPWILVGRTDAEAEAPISWSPDANSLLTGNVPDAGKDWRQRSRRHQRMRWLVDITDAMDMNLSKLQEVVRNREAWCAAVHGVAKNWTWLSNFNQRRQWHPTPVLLPGKSHGQRTLAGCSPSGPNESDMTERLHFHFHALEKEMATHSSVLAWRIPGTAEPGGLPSMGSQSQTRLKCLSSSSRATLTPFHFHSKHCSVKTRTLEPKATRAFISFVARQFGLIYLTRILSHVRD